MSDVEGRSERVCAQGIVHGRVQGVWFRESTRRRAVELSLAGWVRNLADGRVEAHFVGPRRLVEEAIVFVGKGPPLARVTRLEGFEIEPCDAAMHPQDNEPGFVIR